MPIAAKDMDLLTKDQLHTLLAEREGPCLSVFLPTHRKGVETQQDHIRLKNLLREGEQQLASLGLRAPQVRELLAPLQRLVTDTIFWQHQSDLLALFRTADDLAHFRLPIRFEDLVVVGSHFHVKPLLPLVTFDGRFHVLALSQQRVRLLQGTRLTVGEIELGNVPKSLNEVVRPDLLEKSIRFHTAAVSAVGGGQRTSVVHGHGGAGDEANVKKLILRFFQKLDAGICELLKGERAPLVLAGVEYIRAIYREASHYPHLLREGIEGSPDRISSQELHDRGWAAAAPSFERHRKEVVDRYLHLLGTKDPRAANAIETVVPAAYLQSVAVLFVPVGVRFWGTYEQGANSLRVHREKQPGDEDLLNLALLYTLRHGGTVYAVSPSEMPGGSPVAAILYG